MNLRKFYLITTSTILAFLFITGVFILVNLCQINTPNTPISKIASPFKDIITPFRLEMDPVNILILGGDKVAGNTDTMILANYNPSTAKLTLLSIPRDTKVHVKGSSVPKINSAFPVGGSKLAIDTVEKLLNVKIDLYTYIDTSSFRKIIDTLDGIDYEVPVDMKYDDPLQNLHIDLKKGMQHMDGTKAEQYMRFRQPNHYTKEIMKYYDGSDVKRIDAQQNFIKEIIKQKFSILNITKLNNIMSTILQDVESNITLEHASKLSYNIGKMDIKDVTMLKIPGHDSEEPGGWFYIYDKTKTNEVISQYFSGGNGNIINSGNDSFESKPSDEDDEAPPPKKTKPASKPKKGNAKGSVTKNNPSNNETSLEGTNKNIP